MAKKKASKKKRSKASQSRAATRKKSQSKAATKQSGARKKAGPKPSPVELRKELFFPTHIYYCDLPGAETLNKALKRDIYALRGADPEGVVRSNVKQIGSWHSATDLNLREAFARFTRLLDNMVAQVYRDLGYHPDSQAVCDNMWANINPRYGYNRYHTHPNVLWSGVYFVQAPPGAGRVYFRDPREQAQSTAPRFRANKERLREMWSEVYYEPIEGRVLLFPAWLGHEVEPNLTEEEGAAGDRISISFNYVQRMAPPAT